jgi:hypothetical protein
MGTRADQYPEVGLSSGNQALTRCASLGTNPTSALITSGLHVSGKNRDCIGQWPSVVDSENRRVLTSRIGG